MELAGLILTAVALILAIATFAIYVAGVRRSSPRLVLRLSNAGHQMVRLHVPDGDWAMSVSTKSSAPVVLTECTIAGVVTDEVTFESVGLFEPRPLGTEIGLTWRGTEILEKGHFVMFPFRYQCLASLNKVEVRVTLVCTFKPEHWRFPWSMFSLQPNHETLKFSITGDPKNDRGVLLRVGPRETLKVIGPLAQQSVSAAPGVESVVITAVSNDGTYEIRKIKKG